jgi:hypothetical protein
MNGRSHNQTWLYAFALIGVLVAILLFYRLLTAGLQSYLALIAGTMLVVGNIGDLTRSLQQRLLGVAMLNTLVGLALISYFLGTIVLHLLFWPLSVILLIAAAPLTINRAAVARTYLNGARTLVTQARVLLRARQRTS